MIPPVAPSTGARHATRPAAGPAAKAEPMSDPSRPPATDPSASHPASAQPGPPRSSQERPASSLAGGGPDCPELAGVDVADAARDARPSGDAHLPGRNDDLNGQANGPGPDNGGCTQAQLRRFVKSRPYVPLHELRRRFAIGGSEDDVSPVAVNGRTLFVGLPDREAGLLGDLIRCGDVGCELLLDPAGPMIVGIWPTRPVQRS